MYTQDLKNNLSSVLFYKQNNHSTCCMFTHLEAMVKTTFLCVTEVVYASMIISFSELVCFMTRYLGGRAVILFSEPILIWCKMPRGFFLLTGDFFFTRQGSM